jgi:hypothetical protein
MLKPVTWRNGGIKALACVAAAVACCWYQPSFAASFDCQKAKSVPEHLICATPELSQADNDLKLLFDAARESAQDKAAFKENARRSWNDREKSCRDVSCLQKWYAAQKDYYTQLLDGTKSARSAPSIQDTKPFYQNPVYGIGPGLRVCEEFSSVPAGLWGNREKVEVSATVGATGRSLTIVGVLQDRSKSVYQFFFLKNECLAASNQGSKAEGAPQRHVQHTPEILSARFGTSKPDLAQHYAFGMCGSPQGKEMCFAPNTMGSPPPITMIDGDVPCVIGKEVTFGFDKNGSLDGVMCDIFPQSWAKILAALRAESGQGNKEVNQFMGMTTETLRWSSHGVATTLVHSSGQNVRGEPIDSYAVSLNRAP